MILVRHLDLKFLNELAAIMIRNFKSAALAAVFILLVIGLAMNWLTGRETHRSEVIMVLGGLLLCASLLWIRYTRKPPP